MRTPILILILLCGILLSGCNRWCERHYVPPVETRDTHSERRDSTVRLPGASISAVLLRHLDQPLAKSKTFMTVPYFLPHLQTPGQKGEGGGTVGSPPPTAARPAILADTSGRAELRYWYDDAGNLHIDCKCNPIPYTIKDAIRNTSSALTRVRTVNTRGFWYWSGVVAWSLVALVILYQAFLFFNRFRIR